MPELEELETKVLNHLAENPDINKYKIAKALGYPKAGYVQKQVDKLLENKLIVESSTYIRRGQEVENYRPSYIGVNMALLNGADPNKLRENVKLFFQDEQLDLLLLACDVGEHPNLGLEMLRFFNVTSNGLAKGELRIIGLPLENGKLKDFLSLLKKYPRLYKRVHWVLRKALEMTF